MSKIAIVTGANKGIGYFISQQIAEAGVKVLLACRTESLGLEAEVKLKALGLDVEYRQLDVSSDESIDAFAQSFDSAYGRLDILVNNAGIALTDQPAKIAAPTLRTNYFGVLRLSEALLPLLRKSTSGRLVNVASELGHLSNLATDADRAVYSAPTLTISGLNRLVESFVSNVEATNKTPIDETLTVVPVVHGVYVYSKVAVIAATKILARDPANAGVLINAACPGFCTTDLTGGRGPRPPSEGAKTPVKLALLPADSRVNGRFYENEADSKW